MCMNQYTGNLRKYCWKRCKMLMGRKNCLWNQITVKLSIQSELIDWMSYWMMNMVEKLSLVGRWIKISCLFILLLWRNLPRKVLWWVNKFLDPLCLSFPILISIQSLMRLIISPNLWQFIYSLKIKPVSSWWRRTHSQELSP